MSVIVKCPECFDSYEVPDEAAASMIRCRRCQCPIEPKARMEGVQAGPAPHDPPPEDEPQRNRRPRYPEPRSRFPWTALWIVAIGILFFLLAFSVGFNVWFVAQQNEPQELRQERARAEMEVRIRQQAQDEADKAKVMERDAKRGQELLRQELEDVHRELTQAKRDLDATRQELEAARKPTRKIIVK